MSTRAAPLQRQCACGTQVGAGASGRCPACERRKAQGLQARLAVGAVHDPLEHEAEQVADQVLRGDGGRRPALRQAGAALAQQAAAPRAARPHAAPASVDAVLSSVGEPMAPALRSDMEQRFGHDLSRVRIHADGAAARSAQELRAHAWTVGPHIAFAPGRYAPGSAAGRHLLAHELTHVVQQGAATPALVQRHSYDEADPCSGAARTQIDDGQRMAKAAVVAARAQLGQGAPSGPMATWFLYLFGAQAEAKRATIAGRFGLLEEALQQDYTYLCPPATERPCSHAQAEMLSPDRVAICAQRVQTFSRLGMARLLVHENVRRTQGRRSVTNINDTVTGECNMPQRGTEYVEATTDANHPVTHSCFAEKALGTQRAERAQQAQGVFGHLMRPQHGPSRWAGDMTIESSKSTVATTVQLQLQMVGGDFVLTGNYQYAHPSSGPVQGEIVFADLRFEDPPDGERTTIRFDWREGSATGRGYWLSAGADTLKGQWGRGMSMRDGGIWTLQPQP